MSGEGESIIRGLHDQTEGWPAIHLVSLWLCDDCLDGKGGECHTPGCAMWMNRAPDLQLRSKLVLP